MILAPRKHLFATNIIVFLIIWILQKLVKMFCIIEVKAAGGNISSAPANNNSGEERSIVPRRPQSKAKKSFKVIPLAMRKTMPHFGYGEGHYQMFVEEKQRKHISSK